MEAVHPHPATTRPPDELVTFALTLTKDSTLAESLAREAASRTEDPDERRHFIERRVEEHHRQHAAQRLSTWKSLKPRAGLLALPVIIAFAIGLAGGTGLGLARVPFEPRSLTVGAARLDDEFGNTATAEWKHDTAKEFSFTVPPATTAIVVSGFSTGSVEARVNGAPLRGLGGELVVPLDALRDGKNVLTYTGHGTWSISDLKLEAVPLPSPARAALFAAAAERVKVAASIGGDEVAGPFRIWRLLRDAKVFLEAAPGAPSPDITEVRARLFLAADKMSKQCDALLFDAQDAAPAAARLVFDTLADEFPEPSSECRVKADKLKAGLGL